jgi:glycosyltransferase involved in cell wall biosynthesis
MYLLESMASGVPVVQPPLGAFPEIVKRSGGGIIYDQNTPESLCKALSELLTDPKELELLSRAGRNGVETNFNINVQSTEMTKVYQKLHKQQNIN